MSGLQKPDYSPAGLVTRAIDSLANGAYSDASTAALVAGAGALVAIAESLSPDAEAAEESFGRGFNKIGHLALDEPYGVPAGATALSLEVATDMVRVMMQDRILAAMKSWPHWRWPADDAPLADLRQGLAEHIARELMEQR